MGIQEYVGYNIWAYMDQYIGYIWVYMTVQCIYGYIVYTYIAIVYVGAMFMSGPGTYRKLM